MKDDIIGIDLGTYLSSVSIFENGYPKIIPNDFGERFTLSCVSFLNEKEYVVGHLAFKNSLESNDYYISEVKRIIGRNFDDIEYKIKTDKTVFPFGLKEDKNTHKANVIVKLKKSNNNCSNLPIEDNNIKNIENNITEAAKNLEMCFTETKSEKFERENLITKEYSPEYISSLILAKMKKDAENFLHKKIKNAIISVPADFKNDQREYTIKAANMAGLNVLRLINEPTSVAFAYMFLEEEKDFGERKCVVYDFGGGTFDVTILSIKKNKEGNRIIQILGSCGDIYLGGKNFDRNLFDFVCKNSNLKQEEIENDFPLKNRIKNACEKAKIELNFLDKVEINLESIKLGRNLDHFVITKKNFLDVCGELFNRSYEITKKAIKEAGLQISDITDIFLCGGVTQDPKIQKDLRKLFPQARLNNNLNPETVVSMGAAVLSAMYKGQNEIKEKKLVFKEVTSISYGIETFEHKMCVIIPRGTNIPTIREKEFCNAVSNIEKMAINIYEGENIKCKDNHLLGNFFLRDIPKAPAGKVKINVTFKINENAILEVSAKELTKFGKKNQIRIVNGNENILNNNIKKIENMFTDNKEESLKKKLYEYQTKIFEQCGDEEKFNSYKLLTKEISKYLKSKANEDYNENDAKFTKFLLEVQYLFKQYSQLLSYIQFVTPNIIIQIKNDIFFYLKIIVEKPKTNIFQFIEDLKINKEIYNFCMLFTAKEYLIRGKIFFNETIANKPLIEKKGLILAKNYINEVNVILKSHDTKDTFNNLDEEILQYYEDLISEREFYLDKIEIEILSFDAEEQFRMCQGINYKNNLNKYESTLGYYNEILKIIHKKYINLQNKKNEYVIEISDYLGILYFKRLSLYLRKQYNENYKNYQQEDSELLEKIKNYENNIIEEKIDEIRDLVRNEINKGKNANYLNLIKTIIKKYPYKNIENDRLDVDKLYHEDKKECYRQLIDKYYHFNYEKNSPKERENYQIIVEIEGQLNRLNDLCCS